MGLIDLFKFVLDGVIILLVIKVWRVGWRWKALLPLLGVMGVYLFWGLAYALLMLHPLYLSNGGDYNNPEFLIAREESFSNLFNGSSFTAYIFITYYVVIVVLLLMLKAKSKAVRSPSL